MNDKTKEFISRLSNLLNEFSCDLTSFNNTPVDAGFAYDDSEDIFIEVRFNKKPVLKLYGNMISRDTLKDILKE